MRLYLQRFSNIWTLGLILVLGVGLSAIGQGKGHGGDKGDKGKGGGQERKSDNPGHQNREEKREERGQHRKHEDRDNGNDGYRNYPNAKPRYEDRQEPTQENGKWKNQNKQEERNNDRVYPQWQEGPPAWSDAGPKNYGQQRSAQVHARNAERKAAREQARDWDRYYDTRVYRPTSGYNNYSDPRRAQAGTRRSDIIRSVIGMVLGNNVSSGYYAPQQQNNNYNYGAPYDPSYNGGYYNSYPQDQTYGNAPQYYDGYQQNAYPYTSNYGGSPLPGGLNQLILPLLSNALGSRGGFVGRLVSQFLASGYEQGYQAAQYARTNGYPNSYGQDPYTYQPGYNYQPGYTQASYSQPVFSDPAYNYRDVGFNPYSSLDENRRFLAEGYELGYRDALASRNQSPIGNLGGGGLISALLGSVLQVN